MATPSSFTLSDLLSLAEKKLSLQIPKQWQQSQDIAGPLTDVAMAKSPYSRTLKFAAGAAAGRIARLIQIVKARIDAQVKAEQTHVTYGEEGSASHKATQASVDEKAIDDVSDPHIVDYLINLHAHLGKLYLTLNNIQSALSRIENAQARLHNAFLDLQRALQDNGVNAQRPGQGGGILVALANLASGVVNAIGSFMSYLNPFGGNPPKAPNTLSQAFPSAPGTSSAAATLASELTPDQRRVEAIQRARRAVEDAEKDLKEAVADYTTQRDEHERLLDEPVPTESYNMVAGLSPINPYTAPMAFYGSGYSYNPENTLTSGNEYHQPSHAPYASS